MLSAHQPYRDLSRHHQGRRRARSAARRRWPAACRPCATASPRASRAWSCRCSRATSSPWRPAIGLSATTCSTPRSISASATRSCPGLLIGALTFGHLPAVFVPAGPMTSGLPNDEKAQVRQLYAEGKVGRAELLEAEVEVLSLARHLHLLRHRQLQPDADGDHGPAPAGRLASSIPARRCATR